ncbi:extracellular solute-binding protein [Pseudoalteromonas sp. McH1-7]|nr:extracellular solute-binding protein [Pseudoalteromonas sp. McH1-7]USD28807.1 extracellular solute-binding protein [Pseudoalteromonas sp. SCSIO 43201]
MNKSKLFLFLLFWVHFDQAIALQSSQPQVNVYSFRKYKLIQPVIHAFEQETGISVNLVNGKSQQLLSRLRTDGINSQADVLLTSDLIQLHDYKDLLRPLDEIGSWHIINPAFKDDDKRWVSVSMRTRAIFRRKASNTPLPQVYSDLNKPQFKGKFCIRQWSHSYNLALASILYTSSYSGDYMWLEQANTLLAKRPVGGDRDQLRALALGQCELAFANHYYWLMMHHSDNKRDKILAEQLEIHHIKMHSGKTPVSTTTAAISRHAPNAKAAMQFVEFLLKPSTQSMYAELLHEYPVLGSAQYNLVPFHPAIEQIKQGLKQVKRAQAVIKSISENHL